MTTFVIITALGIKIKQLSTTSLNIFDKPPMVLEESSPYNPPDNKGPKQSQGSGTR